MHKSISLPLVLSVSLFGAGLTACGDDSGEVGDEVGETGDGDGDGDAGDGDGDAGDGDGDAGDGDGDAGDGDGDPGDGDGDPGDGDGDAGDGDGDPGDGDGDIGDCQVWEITYDLTGSEFEIDAAAEQVNVVMEPYDQADHVGPGNVVLRFQDVAGEPGGQAFMDSYEMSIHFAITSLGTTVTTDLEANAGPVDCGITSGSLDGTTVAWTPSAIVDHHSVGELLCEGAGCFFADLPNGEPVPVDNTEDQALSDFEFSGDLTSFTMPKTVISEENNSTTSWMYTATEVSRELVAAPACLCE